MQTDLSTKKKAKKHFRKTHQKESGASNLFEGSRALGVEEIIEETQSMMEMDPTLELYRQKTRAQIFGFSLAVLLFLGLAGFIYWF